MRTSSFIDLDGPVHYIDHGGTGTPALLIHGLGGSYLNWERIAPALTASHEVVAVDLRGFGLTPLTGHDARITEQVKLVKAFVRERFGGPVRLIGNSMGGLVSLMTAAEHPDIVDSLVLIDPALPPRSTTTVTPQTVMRLGLPLIPGIGEFALKQYDASLGIEERVRTSLEFMTVDPERIDEATIQAAIEMGRVRLEMPWAYTAFTQATRSIALIMTRRLRFRRLVHSIGAPTLLMHGMEDTVVGFDAASWLAAERPDWAFRPIVGVGHIPQLEVPEHVVELITMWSDTLSLTHR